MGCSHGDIMNTGLTVAQYQRMYFEDISPGIQCEHGRPLRIDGVIGPHTAAHISARKCSVPDQAVGLFGMIAEARIPPNCQGEYRIRIRWDDYPGSGTMGLDKEAFQKQFLRAMDDWYKAIGLKMVESSENPHCVVDFASLAGSTLAWSHLANNSCGSGKQQRYDHRRWTEHLAYLTILHELGHLLGLPHRSGNYIMNPSILTRLEGLTERDVADAIRLGYPGAPDPGPDPEPEPEPEPNDEYEILNTIKIDEPGTYYLVRKKGSPDPNIPDFEHGKDECG